MRNGKLILVAVMGPSAINGSLNISRALAGQGFDVTYLSFGNDHRDYLEMQGFHVHCIDDSNFIYNPPPTSEKFKRLKRIKWGILRSHLFIEHLNREIAQWLDTVKVELVLLDSNSLCHSIPFLSRKLPIINISCTLSTVMPGRNPPVFSGLLPPREKSLFFPVQSKVVWGRLQLSRFYVEFRHRVIVRIAFGKKHFQSIRRQVKMLGGKTTMTEYGPRLVAPEILLGSRCLDFPDLNCKKARLYAGACVDENRQQPDFDFGFINDRKTLIYCAMGTCSKAYSSARNLCRCLFQVMEDLPDCQLVIQTESVKAEDYPNLAENVKVFDRVPQLQLLQRARLFITHGGHGSIREGAFYGVPMIVFPGWHDQPGNAARVVYHRLGFRSSMKSITPRALASMIRNILHNPQILRSVKQMQLKMLEEKEIEPTIRFINDYIDRSDLSPINNNT